MLPTQQPGLNLCTLHIYVKTNFQAKLGFFIRALFVFNNIKFGYTVARRNSAQILSKALVPEGIIELSFNGSIFQKNLFQVLFTQK